LYASYIPNFVTEKEKHYFFLAKNAKFCLFDRGFGKEDGKISY